jgi:hypothetical protein
LKRLFSILTKSKLWILLFVLWLITLCVLSSSSNVVPAEAPKIPHLDKIAHFGYFLVGGYILATWLQLKYGTQSSPLIRFFLASLELSTNITKPLPQADREMTSMIGSPISSEPPSALF